MRLKIAIVGGGASGMFAGYLLSKYCDVVIYEANNKLGKKLLATGNGRCNITNQDLSLDHFHTFGDKKNLNKLIKKISYNKIKQLFEDIGIEFVQDEYTTKIFPASLQASSVVNSLYDILLYQKVTIKLNTKVDTIKYTNNKFIINQNSSYDKVIISTGSKAMQKLGGNMCGYIFAQKFKHTITPLYPALVQLVSSNKNLDIINGVKIKATIENQMGDILFTKYGLSGSLILDLSKQIAIKLQNRKKIILFIDILPTYSKETLIQKLLSRQKKLFNRDIFSWLDGFLNKKLAKYIIICSKLENKKVSQLTKKDINKLVYMIKHLSFEIIDTKGFENAEICAGGVSLEDIDLSSLESKKQKNLFFTGEVLDVDGNCGGYNLHWAWSSAYIVANHIKKEVI